MRKPTKFGKRYEEGGLAKLYDDPLADILRSRGEYPSFSELGLPAYDDPENKTLSAGIKEGVRSRLEPRELAASLPQKSSSSKDEEDKSISFREAFAKARANKQKTFPWRGKTYSTDLASSKPKGSSSKATIEPTATPKENPELSRKDVFGMEPDAYIRRRRAEDIAKRENKAEFARETNRSARDVFGMEPDAYVKMRRAQMGMKKGGKVSSASKRADGAAQRGKTRGRMV